MPEDLGGKGMTERVDTVAHHTLTQEISPEAMSELSYHQPNQSSQQDHALIYPQPTELNQDL